MSKSRGKIDVSHPGDGKKPFAPDGAALWISPAAQWGIAATTGVAFLAYLAIFFVQKLAEKSVNTRLAMFSYLLTPDDLAREWVEGKWGNFAVVDRVLIAFIALLSLGLALCAGMLTLYLSRVISKTTRLEHYIFRIGVGLQLISLSVLLGGLFGERYTVSIISVGTIFTLALVTLALHRLLRGRTPADNLVDFHPPVPAVLAAPPKQRSTLVRAAEYGLTIVLVLLTVAILLGAMLPPWDFDVREYHLQVPKEWGQNGRVTFLPHNVYGNMPLGAELSAGSTYQFVLPHQTQPLVSKLVIGCYGPLTALLLCAAGCRFWSKLAGLAAAVIYLSSPWVMHVSVNGLNEAALGFYFFAALYATFLGGKGRPCAGLAGFFAGAAASVKYTGAVFVVMPLFVLTLWHQFAWKWREEEKEGSSYGSPRVWRAYPAMFLLMVFLSCGLWYGKNWVLTGNPVYPLMGSVFGGATRTPEKTDQWNNAHRPPPYNFKQLGASVANVGWRDKFQNPLLVPLTALGIVALGSAVRSSRTASQNPQSAICNLKSAISLHALTVTLLFLLFFLAAWWLFTHRLERFLVPAIPLAALLAGAGVEYARNKALKYVVAGLMVVGLTYNLLMASSPLVGDNRWFVSLERLRTDEPRMEGDVSRIKPAIRWLNEHVKPGEAVLCVGEAAVFDLEMPVFYNTCFDDCLLVNWTLNKTAAERKEEFHSRKIAYVYFDEAEIKRYRSDDNYDYDPRFDQRIFEELVRQKVLEPPLTNAPPKIYPVAP